MKRKIVWMSVSFLMVLSLVLASCGPAAPEEEEEVIVPAEEEEEEEEEEEVVVPVAEGPKYGGTITVSSHMVLSSPNTMQIGAGMLYFGSFTHDRLGVADWTKGPAGTGEVNFTNATYYYPYVGALAESWEQPDPYTYVLHIRQGVHWHNKPPVNGRELVADDVVYSMEDLLSHPEISTNIDRAKLESITATDKYTVEIKANAIDIRFLDAFMVGPNVIIRPPEPEETYGEGFTEIDGHCGTGPFVMTDFVTGSVVTLERNPEYWAYDELNSENKLPYADGIKYFIITDKSTYLSALRTAKIDFLTRVGIDDTDSLKQTNPEMEYAPYLSNMLYKLVMRQDKEDLPFSDVRVRKALAMAIDREAIVEDYLQGQGEILSYPVHPYSTEVYIPLEELPEATREQFEYDPEKSKQLLADAGYPDGFQTECTVTQSNTEPLQIFVAYWKAIGVDCEIKIVDMGAWMNLSSGKRYEQMLFGTAGTQNPMNTLAERTSDAYFNSDMHFDPDYDAKVATLIETLDKDEQNQLMQELTLSWHEGVNCIAFPGEVEYNFWWPWLKNCHGESTLGFHNTGGLIARIWVDQELKKEMGY